MIPIILYTYFRERIAVILIASSVNRARRGGLLRFHCQTPFRQCHPEGAGGSSTVTCSWKINDADKQKNSVKHVNVGILF